MYIRVAKCRFGQLIKRYHQGEDKEVAQSVETTLCDPKNKPEQATLGISSEKRLEATRGIAAGLDKSHNRDYTIKPVSDPLLIVHTKPEQTHRTLIQKLKELNLSNYKLIPIELPRTGPHGEMEWAPGFKTLPKNRNHLDRFKDPIEENHTMMCFTSKTDIEAEVPDPTMPQQNKLGEYTSTQTP